MGEGRRQRDIRERRQVIEQAVELKDHAYLPPQLPHDGRRRCAWTQRHVAYLDGPTLERFKGGDRAQDRGLARSGLTHQRHDLAAGDLKRHPAQDHPCCTPQPDVANRDDDVAHDVGAFHRCSSLRASADSGSDIAR